MPESLQSSERGEQSQEAINELEFAISHLEGLDALDVPDEIDLGEAIASLETAAQ
jgi:hypothetical protein